MSMVACFQWAQLHSKLRCRTSLNYRAWGRWPRKMYQEFTTWWWTTSGLVQRPGGLGMVFLVNKNPPKGRDLALHVWHFVSFYAFLIWWNLQNIKIAALLKESWYIVLLKFSQTYQKRSFFNFNCISWIFPTTQDSSHHQDYETFLVGNPYKPSWSWLLLGGVEVEVLPCCLLVVGCTNDDRKFTLHPEFSPDEAGESVEKRGRCQTGCRSEQWKNPGWLFDIGDYTTQL